MAYKKKQTLTKLNRKVNRLARATKPELKYHDVIYNQSAYLNGSSHFVNAISEGTTAADRTGNEIRLKSLKIVGSLHWSSLGVNTSEATMWVIKDTQQVLGTAPTFGTVFEGYGNLSLLNSSNIGRFKILSKKRFTYNKNVLSLPIDISVNHKDMVSKYSGSLSTSIQHSGVFIMIASNQALNVPAFSLHYRTTYTDV